MENPNHCTEQSAKWLMGTVLKKLLAAKAGRSTPTIPKVKISKTTADMFKSLLFNAEHSDVLFCCGGAGSAGSEEKIPAHRNILAAASPYFKAQLSSDWADATTEDGITTIKIDGSPAVLRSMLTFMYTGEVVDELESLEPSALVELLGVAHKYGLVELTATFESFIVENHVEVNSVPGLLQLCSMYGDVLPRLRAACDAFIARNAHALFSNPEMIKLLSEQPDILTKHTAAVAGGQQGAEEGKEDGDTESSGDGGGGKRQKTNL